MYFNARFDDVMLIVKCEMASVLRGPLPATLWGCAVFISFMFQFRYRNHYIGISCPGKLGFDYIYFSGMLKYLFYSSAGGRAVCVC